MEHLITPNELKSLGRPIGKIDDAKLWAYIAEAEHMYVKPVLGVRLFLDLLEYGENKADYRMLLNGGIFTDENDNVISLMGLKVTLAYYVYAQNVMSGDIQSTRFGLVVKDSDYSSHVSSKERSDLYNNVLEVANSYMGDCVKYCQAKGLLSQAKRKLATGSIIIRKIG